MGQPGRSWAITLLLVGLAVYAPLRTLAAEPPAENTRQADTASVASQPASQAEEALAHINQARVLAAQGDGVGAEEHYRAALALSPSPSLFEELIALLEQDPTRKEDVDRLWNEYLDVFPHHPLALLANGDRLYAAGSYTAAAEAYDRGASAAPRDARFPARRGNCMLSLGDYEGAILLYSHSLERGFEPVVVASLAATLEALGRAAEAEDVWRRAIATHPNDADLAMQYGMALYSAGDYAAALVQYQRGQQLEPENDRFFNRAGLCLYQLEHIEEAVAQVEQALALRPDPCYYLNLALGYRQLNSTERADACYREGLERYPEDAELLDSYAEFLVLQGDLLRALEQLRALIDASPSVGACIRLAELAYQADDLAQADAAYRQALAIAPADSGAIAAYAVFLAALRRDDELLAHIATARTKLASGDYARVVETLSSYWLDQEQYGEAAQILQEIIAIDPLVPAAYNALALCQQLLGDSRAALATIKRGLNDAGDNYAGRYLEAYITSLAYGPEQALPLLADLIEHPQADASAFELYLELAPPEESGTALLEVAQRGLAAHPESEALLRYVATEHYESGRTDQAIRVLTDRRHRDVDWPERDSLLGRAYLREGNFVKAAAHLVVATTVQPEDAELWTILGEAQYLMHDFEQARAALTRALALDGELPAAHLWLGLVLLDQGDLQGAALSLGEAAASDRVWPGSTAWIALAQARLALRRGDQQSAYAFLEQAAAAGQSLPGFAALLGETRAEAGL